MHKKNVFFAKKFEKCLSNTEQAWQICVMIPLQSSMLSNVFGLTHAAHLILTLFKAPSDVTQECKDTYICWCIFSSVLLSCNILDFWLIYPSHKLFIRIVGRIKKSKMSKLKYSENLISLKGENEYYITNIPHEA